MNRRPTDEVEQIIEAWRRERPDLPTASIGIVTRIWRIGRLLEQRRDATLRAAGTDRSTLDLLSTLRRAGHPYELTPSEIAKRTLLTTGAVSQRLAKAERAGLIQRLPSITDGRSSIVGLTADGDALLNHTVAAVLESEEQAISSLGADERSALADLLRHLHHSLLTGSHEAPATPCE